MLRYARNDGVDAVAHDISPTFGASARPSGKTPRTVLAPRLSSPADTNIPLYRNSDLSHKRTTLARDKGRIAIVTNRGPGSDGRDGVGARGVAGRDTVSNRLLAHTTRR